MIRRCSFSTLCAVIFFALPLVGQTLGEITGHVSDSSGAAVPQANIALTNTNTNALRNTVSTDSGDYNFPSLPPGTYNIRVERTGFKAEISKDIVVQVQQSVRLDFAVQVGQLSQAVEVAAAADLLQAETRPLAG